MERLSFKSKFAYNASEAAIHMARYQLAAPFCEGKRVLDIACGEGYGSLALKRFGAATVEAVDNVPEAIETARQIFASPGIKHHVGDAEKVDQLFPAGEFDVVVSLETIEHLRNPETFLRAIRKVAKPDAVIIISCPNDYWYYPSEAEANPYHVNKYTFDEFRRLTTNVLGTSGVWAFGVPIVGFGNVTETDITERDAMIGQAMMLDFAVQASAITLPRRQFSKVNSRNCCYFVGLWGGSVERLRSAAVLPISMDQYTNLVSWESANESPQRIYELEAELANSSPDMEGSTVERATSDYAELAVDLADFAKQKATEIGQLRNRLHLKSVQADAYRIQAFALSKEVEILSRRVGELAAEREQLQNLPQTSVSELLQEKHELEQRLDQLLLAAHVPVAQPGLGLRMKHAGKMNLRRAGLAVQPYLPHPARELARRVANKLKL